MCRLFSWSSAEPLTLEQVLGSDLQLLTDLSSVHSDGWGGALRTGNDMVIVRDIEAANHSADYKEMVHERSAEHGIVHLRWATSNFSVCVENTHPFSSEDMAFIHNGGFESAESLVDLIDADLLAERAGTVDSELYFLYLRTLLRSKDMVSAYRELIPVMDEITPFTSLNSMILTPTHLYVVAAYEDARRPSDVDEDYYHLAYENDGDVFSAWSSGVRSIAGTRLPNNHIGIFAFASQTFSIESLI